MGNGVGKIRACFTGAGAVEARRSHQNPCFYMPDAYDEGLGHSFCYVRSDPTRIPISDEPSAGAVASIFRSISGASVSANTSTPLSTAFSADPTIFSSSAFESSTSFAAIPLQPFPRSGPISERRFMSGPIERGFLSAPLDRAGPIISGPLDRSSSHGGTGFGSGVKPKNRTGSLLHGLRRAISKTFGQRSVAAPVKGSDQVNWVVGGFGSGFDNTIITNNKRENITVSGSLKLSSETSLDDVESLESQNLQWAQGKAGEDRVHVVVSEEHGWVFVGIYDGFNGPDATDFLLSNLYSYVQKELKGLLWDDCSKFDSSSSSSSSSRSSISSSISNNVCFSDRSRSSGSSSNSSDIKGCYVHNCCEFSEQGNYATVANGESNSVNGDLRSKNGRNSTSKKKYREGAKKRWKYEWDRERLELDRRLKEQWNHGGGPKSIDHLNVLKALSQALKKTEAAYLDIADKMLDENPELSLMGSCVLIMLMKGEDVYVINVGDSRAVLAQDKEPDLRLGKIDQDLERINEEPLYDFDVSDGVRCNLNAFQLTMDHSTSIEEEVRRIRDEHPDDAFAVVNDRVKGSLKVTRAFGAGFLKQPKWNDALLEMFRIDYIGTSAYINCLPSLCHHRLGSKDRFLILSSDGLYQYFTNEEAVSEVELFISLSPEGDPAQHLVEEVLFRAAKKAGMDFHELLEIPQGDRRKYHDDVSVIVISFEGTIWRSCV